MRDFAKTKFTEKLDAETAGKLEGELYKYAVDEVRIPFADWDFDCVRQVYKHKLRAIVTALRDDKEFVQKVRDSLSDVVFMSASEMSPSIWEDVVAATPPVKAEDNGKDERYGEAACTSCLRRGQPCHQTTYSQLQTRSADEGLTTYFLCYNCGKRWRQS